MLSDFQTEGLIVSIDPQQPATLAKLTAFCGWPVLSETEPRRLRRELLMRAARLSLIWLDDEHQIAPSMELLSWLATFRPAMGRIALAYQLAEDTEAAVRRAGAQIYLPASDNLGAVLNGPLLDYVRDNRASQLGGPRRDPDREAARGFGTGAAFSYRRPHEGGPTMLRGASRNLEVGRELVHPP